MRAPVSLISAPATSPDEAPVMEGTIARVAAENRQLASVGGQLVALHLHNLPVSQLHLGITLDKRGYCRTGNNVLG